VHNAVPIDREKVLQAAQKFVEKRRFDRAIAEYQKIVQEDPTDARILLKIGDLQARMDAHPDAIATYERVAKYYAQQGFSVKAIAVYKQIREMIRKYVPRLADQYSHIIPKLGELYSQLGLTGDALTTYDEYATLLQNAGREAEAIDVFRKIVELNGSNPLARLRLAEALSRDKGSDEALAEFSRAADILMEMGRRDDALKVYERLLLHRPDPVKARRAAEMYLERDQPNDGMMALAKLQICFQADQRNLDTLDLLAKAFILIGQGAKALEVRKEAVRIAREQGRGDIARQVLAELMAAAPDDDGVRSLAHSLMPPRPDKQEDAQIEVSAEEPIPLSGMGSDGLEQDELGLGEGGYDDFDFPDEAARSRREPEVASAIAVDEAQEAAEDINAGPMSFRGPAPVAEVLDNAEAFRKLRLLSKAVETLRIALELNPASLELHHALNDVLLESGDTPGAIDEMITLSAMYADMGQTEDAGSMLSEVLQVDIYHARARELLLDLGYEPPELPLEPVNGAAFGGQEGFGAYDEYQGYVPESQGPLPSYDLEEIAPADAMTRSHHSGYEQFATTDDPFGETLGQQPFADEPFAGEQPLPSFPLGEDRRGRLELIAPEESFSDSGQEAEEGFGGGDAEGYAGAEYPSAEFPNEEIPTATVDEMPMQAGASGPATDPGSMGGETLDDALEEAEFFASRNLFDDALSIIDEQLTRFPNHPILLERQRELRELLEAEAGGGGALAPAGLPSSPPVDDHSFDIAASLGAMDELDSEARQADATRLDSPVDVEEVFAKFKEGVTRQVADTDSQSHYDLGVAYKEMGLVKDAVREFEMAARDAARECVCHSMIGLMLWEQGDTEGAVNAFIRGLHAEHKTTEQELALYYDLGSIHESRKNSGEALYYFHKVLKREPKFRDVAAKVRALQPKPAPAAAPVRTGTGEDDFDRAFEDLFDNK
jgi:tetratricopeptide (TPR) repeat protein